MGGQGGIRPISLQEYARFPLRNSLGSLHEIPEDRPVTLDGPRIPLQESLQEFDIDSASRNPGNELPYGWARGNTPGFLAGS
jgi:hypothetical protein